MNIAEQLRQEQRNNEKFQSVKIEAIKIIKEQITRGKHSIIFSFEIQPEGTVGYHKYCQEWWSVSEKHRIPLTEYLKNEGFVVKPGPLYCENIDVSL